MNYLINFILNNSANKNKYSIFIQINMVFLIALFKLRLIIKSSQYY
ncbi:hypothetical protein A1OE_684 [Candidatus Endolissoclinum faulkneri L2]|uniref:Uncharacterized protein n=1 Tax=Candidatus Endolissoclinum faulkneri L2 TaxID=1193729 RepID=K7YMY6_9PROT|nr:hypothetical protein A1OE_684 [Candidatus Endolissoclinum faulkneri L2]